MGTVGACRDFGGASSENRTPIRVAAEEPILTGGGRPVIFVVAIDESG
jgi:hypothetical protein